MFGLKDFILVVGSSSAFFIINFYVNLVIAHIAPLYGGYEPLHANPSVHRNKKFKPSDLVASMTEFDPNHPF